MHIAERLDWIAELPRDIRSEFRARMTSAQFSAGEIITQSGTPAMCIHQVQSGYVKILKDLPSGDQVLLALYIPGNVFSESAVIVGREHHHTTIAATNVTLNLLKKPDFDALYHTYREVPENLCRKLAHSMSLFLENREFTSLHDIRTQVALLFCNLADRCADQGRDDSHNSSDSHGHGIQIDVPLTVTDIADFLGVSRQTVQKEISILKAQGTLDKTAGKWVVQDLPKLRQEAEQVAAS